jgi:hypothetical protein
LSNSVVMPSPDSVTVPGVVSWIAWKRSPPCTAVTALPTVVPPLAVASAKLSARLPSVPTPLLPLASPVMFVTAVVSVVPTGCAAVSAGVNVMPVPAEVTGVSTACAFARAGVKVTPVPGPDRSSTAALVEWTMVRLFVSVIEPVATEAIVSLS